MPGPGGRDDTQAAVGPPAAARSGYPVHPEAAPPFRATSLSFVEGLVYHLLAKCDESVVRTVRRSLDATRWRASPRPQMAVHVRTTTGHRRPRAVGGQPSRDRHDQCCAHVIVTAVPLAIVPVGRKSVTVQVGGLGGGAPVVVTALGFSPAPRSSVSAALTGRPV